MYRLDETILVPEHFSEKAKSYYVSYDALTNTEKAMKADFLSIFDAKIHYWEISKARSIEDMKEHFGIYYIPFLFVVCELILPLT